eukprot:scaffold45095_cov48-Phaeocystis_antarctica.AAC.1
MDLGLGMRNVADSEAFQHPGTTLRAARRSLRERRCSPCPPPETFPSRPSPCAPCPSSSPSAAAPPSSPPSPPARNTCGRDASEVLPPRDFNPEPDPEPEPGLESEPQPTLSTSLRPSRHWPQPCLQAPA